MSGELRTLGFTGPVILRHGRDVTRIEPHEIRYLPPENAEELRRASGHVCDLTLREIAAVHGVLVPRPTVGRYE